jgi:hypothetical protein
VTTIAMFADNLRAFDGRLRPALRTEMASTMAHAEQLANARYDERLKRRTGRLARTIAGAISDTADGFEGTLRGGGGEIRYGRIQEEGGEVKPGPGRRFLAIPKGPALTPAGVPRYASPREVGGLRFVPIRGGAMGLLVKDHPGRGKAGSGARSDVWFLLVRKVNIRAKYFLRDGFHESIVGLDDRLAVTVRRAMEPADG